MRRSSFSRFLLVAAIAPVTAACVDMTGVNEQIAMLGCAAMGVSGCVGSGNGSNPSGGWVKIEWEGEAIGVGDTIQATATYFTASGSPTLWPQISWESGDTLVARVDATGRIRGEAPGGVMISATATSQGISAQGSRWLSVISR